MPKYTQHYGSRALVALLLLFLTIPALAACAGSPVESGRSGAPQSPEPAADVGSEATAKDVYEGPAETTGDRAPRGAKPAAAADELEGFPEYRNWYEAGAENEPVQFESTGSSAGAIPAVRPFNFGRDPGGPADKTLYLTIPAMGISDVPVLDSISEEALEAATVHVPATGFPWQEGANVYIAGHRLGYPGTGSYRVFYDLDVLEAGDEVILRDADGGEYVYRVTEQAVLPPDAVEVMNPVEGKSIVSLQTCTLPDYSERIVVQGELVRST